ncbi:MAG TPA: AMP-binding protein [Gemmatimonadaceae bacterium]|nr:AMP-binding protein [Gemmatimonadaceae bacterium]
MTDPLALLPLAAAAHGGRVDAFEAQQLVAAGLTLLRRCAPLVRALSGKRAAILLPTGPAFLTALAASEGRGAVLVNPFAAPAEIERQLADARVGAVFTIGALERAIPAAVPRVLLDESPARALWSSGGERREIDLGSHVGFSIEGEADVPGLDEEAAIVYTSAMAGTPLGAILTHRNLLANARATVEAAELGPHDHALALLPFSHLFGLTVTLLAPLLAGARVTPMARFHPARAIQAIETAGITLLVGVPAVYEAMAAVLERHHPEFRAPALRVCICGGAPLSTSLQERWRSLTGVELRQGYGLTEAAPVCLFNRTALPNRPGTLGVPFPGVEVSIRDDAGYELPRGAVGEICVSGENVFAGYVSGAELGLRREGGWLHTGDLGAMDGEGSVTFHGMLKPMFTRNAFNIYPREIERAALELPGVRRAAVHAEPNPLHENDIVLEVWGDATADELHRWCAGRLSAYKQPTRIIVHSG